MNNRKLIQAFLYFIVIISAQHCAYSQNSSQAVYITRTGEKFHTENCRYLKYSSYKIPLKEAQDRGYTPCSVCKPLNSSKSSNQTVEGEGASVVKDKPAAVPNSESQTQSQTTTSQQCQATTKAGSRCKRMTNAGNGKCWQHQ